jgi:two-component system sensor histidine kinase FlrB
MKNDIDIALLSQAMDVFNEATVKLQSSYELLQDEARKLREEIEDKNRALSYMSNLLESVLNNTGSSIMVLDNAGQIVLQNSAAEQLLTELGEEAVKGILREKPRDELPILIQDRYFRLSCCELNTEELTGVVFVVDDITSIKRYELERQRGENLQLMGEMVANIAHEIRNPLGSMELFASLLERELINPDQKRLTTNIIKAIRIINGTISNTLLFTKETEPDKSCYVLADIVDDVILYLQHTIREKKVAIVNKLGEETVNCQLDLFRQVVMNIIHNAIDAVDVGGQVELSAIKSDGKLNFAVRDNGHGLPQEMRAKLFMPFQTTKAKGTGLGLSIAYKIAKAHSGDITAESDGATFTVFTVSLPE